MLGSQMYWLDILNGPARGRRKIQRRSLVMGSDLSCHFWVDTPGVAPRHAELIERAGAVLLRLLARAPSTQLKLNGETVRDECLLSDGDTIEIAGIRIRYRARLPWRERLMPVLRWMVPFTVVLAGVGWGIWRWWFHPSPGPAVLGEPAVMEPPVPAPTLITEPAPLIRMDALGEAVQAAASRPSATQAQETVAPALPPPAPAPPAEEESTIMAIDAPISREDRTQTAALTLMTDSVSSARAAEPAPVREGPAVITFPSPQPGVSSFERQIKAAEALAEAGVWERALSIIAEVPPSDPGFARALALRARAAEHAGQLRDAEKFWTQVLELGSGTLIYETAFRALIRLAERQVALAPPPLLDWAASVTGRPPAVAPAPPELPAAVIEAMNAPRMSRGSLMRPSTEMSGLSAWSPNQSSSALHEPQRSTGDSTQRPMPTVSRPVREPFRAVATAMPPASVAVRTGSLAQPHWGSLSCTIVRADLTRFPVDDAHDDLRVLNLQLRLDGTRDAVPLTRFQVEVTFFDRAVDSLQVFPSRVAQGSQQYQFSGQPWAPGEVRQLTFSYLVPKGAREREFREQKVGATFHGYRIRVLFDGRPIAVYARPADLAELR